MIRSGEDLREDYLWGHACRQCE